MNKILLTLIPALLMMTGCMNNEKIRYPETRMTDTVDTYFGTEVADPYRWLENDTSAETEAWVTAQNEVTNAYLAKIPYREQIRERLTELWNYPRYGVPFHKGNFYFFFKNDGIQNQSILYIQDSLGGEPRVFLDPNKLSGDGTTSLGTYSVSKDGKYFAFAI